MDDNCVSGEVIRSNTHTDRMGSPILVNDKTVTLQWKTNSLPYGQTVNTSGSATQNVRLPGQYADASTSLYDNGFRTYSEGPSGVLPGRYMQADPIGLGGGLNPYRYVNGMPLNKIDPWGLESAILEPTTDRAYWDDKNYNNDDFFTVGSHGSKDDHNHIMGRDGGWNTTASTAADEIINEGFDGSKPVQLIICHAALGGQNSFAQQLADELSAKLNLPVTVIGSEDIVGVRGSWLPDWMYSGYVNPGSGGWKTFQGNSR